MTPQQLATLIAELQGITQNGFTYAKDPYDLERYQQLAEITKTLIKESTNFPTEKIDAYIKGDGDYATPKVDVRAIVFDEVHQLLMVKEKSDNSWALPGGWADIGYSPFEIAEKETWEEAGIKVTAKQLIGVRDKAKHDYPAALLYTYKLFIYCEAQSLDVTGGLETSDACFFSESELEKVAISHERNTLADLKLMFAEDLLAKNFCD